jgi:hypothetical protein
MEIVWGAGVVARFGASWIGGGCGGGNAAVSRLRCAALEMTTRKRVCWGLALLLLGLLELAEAGWGLFGEGLGLFYEDDPVFGDGEFAVQ